MRRCPQCGATFPDEGRFCPLDGIGLLPVPRKEGGGPLIGGRFELLEEIGQGATAIIYRARHVALGHPCAVKILRPEFALKDRSLRRFLREALIVARVDHPHVVRMYDFGKTVEDQAYLVMEHLSGPTLFEVLKATAGLPLRRALRIAVQIAEALAHAHERGVIHRDVKPENILLTERYGQPDWVKILDFGLAKVFDLPPLSAAGEVFGTPAYLSPEALTGSAHVAAPADVYALGILLHDCLAGSPPFDGDILQILRQHHEIVPAPLSSRCRRRMPEALDALVGQMLEKDPAARPDAAAVATELRRLAQLVPAEPAEVRESLPLLDELIAGLFPPGQPVPGPVRGLRHELAQLLRRCGETEAQRQQLEAEAQDAEHRMLLNIETLRGRILNLEEQRAEPGADLQAQNAEILRLEEELYGVEEVATAGWHRRELQALSESLQATIEALQQALRQLIDRLLAEAPPQPPPPPQVNERVASLRRRLTLLRPG